VCERERERKGEKERGSQMQKSLKDIYDFEGIIGSGKKGQTRKQQMAFATLIN